MHLLSHRRFALRRALGALAVVTALACLLAATEAFAITRNTVLARAQVRVDKPVPYSQSKYYAGYRTDCSGYVSMCWSTGTSYNTRSFYLVTHPIKVASLKPGDAMLKKGYHIRLFYGWLDDNYDAYVAYESASGVGIAGTTIRSAKQDMEWGYVPVRYDRIEDSRVSRNRLKNPTFDVWGRAWSGDTEKPMWWEATGPYWDPKTFRRKDIYKTARNALQLDNATADPASASELSQIAAVTPNALYKARVYARGADSTAVVQLSLSYLDGNGASVLETSTPWREANTTTFAYLSLLETSPADALFARFAVRVAGGVTTLGEELVEGSAVVLDDASLFRPQLKVTITRSRSTAYNGKTATLSGYVTPTASIGTTATLYVKTPGSASYKQLGTSRVYDSDGRAKWKATYAFKKGMARGTYRFRAKISGVPGYLGVTSDSVTVKLY